MHVSYANKWKQQRKKSINFCLQELSAQLCINKIIHQFIQTQSEKNNFYSIESYSFKSIFPPNIQSVQCLPSRFAIFPLNPIFILLKILRETMIHENTQSSIRDLPHPFKFHFFFHFKIFLVAAGLKRIWKLSFVFLTLSINSERIYIQHFFHPSIFTELHTHMMGLVDTMV